MSYFLLVYERSTGKLLEQQEFAEAQASVALSVRSAREAKERGHPDIEVILLSSESLDTLKRTHARYFRTAGEMAADLQKRLAAEHPAKH